MSAPVTEPKFAGLKVGDKVWVQRGWGPNTNGLREVLSVGRVWFSTGYRAKFRLSDGCGPADSQLRAYTLQERAKEVERDEAVSQVHAFYSEIPAYRMPSEKLFALRDALLLAGHDLSTGEP